MTPEQGKAPPAPVITEEQQVLDELAYHGWEPVEQPAEHAPMLPA